MSAPDVRKDSVNAGGTDSFGAVIRTVITSSPSCPSAETLNVHPCGFAHVTATAPTDAVATSFE